MKFLTKVLLGGAAVSGSLIAIGYAIKKEEETQFLERIATELEELCKQRIEHKSEDDTCCSNDEKDDSNDGFLFHEDSNMLTVDFPITEKEWNQLTPEEQKNAISLLDKTFHEIKEMIK